MREPTPMSVLFDWHRRALEHVMLFRSLRDFNDPPTHNDPQCGYYQRRLVKDGPWVAAAIWMLQDIDEETGELMMPEVLMCEVDGKAADPYDIWSYVCGSPIPESRYRFLHAHRRWAIGNAPGDPSVSPRTKIDPVTMPLPF